MRTLFVHGRPAGHPLHMKYGAAVCKEANVEDPWIRWHDRNLPAPLRYIAWFVNALAFVSLKETVVLTEGLRITLVIARFLSLGRLKLIALVDDESPYFIHSGYYRPVSKAMNRWAYNRYHAWICIGKMETALMKEIIPRHEFIFTGFNGVEKNLSGKLLALSPRNGSTQLLFVGSCAAPWRAWYKGLDLVLDACNDLIRQGLDLQLLVVGQCPPDTMRFLAPHLQFPDRVIFAGQVDNIIPVIQKADVVVHPGRGEAWGISVLEAMMGGVVPVVSEWTGVSECVMSVDPRLVVPLETSAVAESLKRILLLPAAERSALATRCRTAAIGYTEEAAIAEFVACFRKATA